MDCGETAECATSHTHTAIVNRLNGIIKSVRLVTQSKLKLSTINSHWHLTIKYGCVSIGAGLIGKDTVATLQRWQLYKSEEGLQTLLLGIRQQVYFGLLELCWQLEYLWAGNVMQEPDKLGAAGGQNSSLNSGELERGGKTMCIKLHS